MTARRSTDARPSPDHDLMREHLARELHDGVAGQLQTMLVEMELMRRREGAPSEIDEFRHTVRCALVDLRQILRDLRDLPADPALVQSRIDDKVASALARWPGPPGSGQRA